MVLTEKSEAQSASTNVIHRDGRIGDSDTFYTEWEETYDSFDQMGMHENLLRGIYAYGGFLAAVILHPWCLVCLPALHRAGSCVIQTFGVNLARQYASSFID